MYMCRYMRMYRYMYIRIRIRVREHFRYYLRYLRDQYCYLRNLIAFCCSNASNECVANIMIYVSYHFLI